METQTQPSVPDLIIPTGRLHLVTVAEGRAQLVISETETLEVILPMNTDYSLEIGKVYRARWRPSELPAGIWSFYCQVADEKLWLEANDLGEWKVNHDLAPIHDPSPTP